MSSSSVKLKMIADLTGPRGGKIAKRVSVDVILRQHFDSFSLGHCEYKIPIMQELDAVVALPWALRHAMIRRLESGKRVAIRGVGSFLICELVAEESRIGRDRRMIVTLKSTGPFTIPRKAIAA